MSGDYYDVISGEQANERALFAIADVSGKGAPAALLASTLHAGLHSQTPDPEFDLVRAMERLNALVARHSPGNIFATMLLGEMVTRDGSIRYVRAGHELPCHVRADGSVARPAAGGGLLGIDIGMRFELTEIATRPGDVFCVYTDGVTDMEDADGTPFGPERLTRVLSEHRGAAAERIGAAIVRAVDEFSSERIDDLTFIVIRRVAVTS